MSQQYDVRSELVGRVAQSVVPRCPGCSFRTAVAADLHGSHLDRVEAERAALPGSGLGYLPGVRLEAVVDDDRAGPEFQLGRLERGRRGQRERVCATGAGYEDRRVAWQFGKRGSHRLPGPGDGGMEPSASALHQLLRSVEVPFLGPAGMGPGGIAVGGGVSRGVE